MVEKLDPLPNLTELAYLSIKRSMLEGKVEWHQRLTEDMLASQLGISKSPVREALNTLQGEGLIRIESRRGAYLRQFTAQDVNDLYDLRGVLEAHAVAKAKVTPELLQALWQSVDDMKQGLQSHDKVKHIEEDNRFHALIAQATGNEELGGTLRNVQNKIWLCRSKSYDLSSSTAPAAHAAIVEALESGDKKKAQRCMRDHIETVRKRLVKRIDEESRPGAKDKGKDYGDKKG
ncbi:GntR family transcriptional regulator [Granulicella tundricola]|uniref:Transcriptional regulator, GntR family n=1 Tax=Granulicella tundricola (strain ATCC BAA-1859 / DSM 23138 / MP5ACTX9) TaxID=1198114 RepID=E8X5S6_GRATM|nr:GntR family transcriptional regulator [Granulicella tundricola]ADW70810.1 transcriptional regulator, GntR family [Granulicella tundricola MP5ACTX9]